MNPLRGTTQQKFDAIRTISDDVEQKSQEISREIPILKQAFQEQKLALEQLAKKTIVNKIAIAETKEEIAETKETIKHLNSKADRIASETEKLKKRIDASLSYKLMKLIAAISACMAMFFNTIFSCFTFPAPQQLKA